MSAAQETTSFRLQRLSRVLATRSEVEDLRRAISEHRTSDGDGSLLPTLTASSYGTNRGGSAGRTGKERMSLQTMARRGILPTLTVKGNYNRKGASSRSGDGLATVLGGVPNPTWCEWFMGFPLRWTELDALGIARLRYLSARLSADSQDCVSTMED